MPHVREQGDHGSQSSASTVGACVATVATCSTVVSVENSAVGTLAVMNATVCGSAVEDELHELVQ